MSNNAAAKRSRATSEQLNQMVDFMLNNPGLAGGKFQKLHGKLECDKKWSEMGNCLNALGGAVKTVEQWHTVWKDLKRRTSISGRERKKQQALTGNRPITQEPITELEKRVVAVIGSEYIEGNSSVIENVPMKEEQQIMLEDGADYIFDLPTSPAIEELQCATPKSYQTPKRCGKRNRLEEEDVTKKQFLAIAEKQADAQKILAESTAENAKATKMLAEHAGANCQKNDRIADAIKVLAESINASASAVYAFANAINRL